MEVQVADLGLGARCATDESRHVQESYWSVDNERVIPGAGTLDFMAPESLEMNVSRSGLFLQIAEDEEIESDEETETPAFDAGGFLLYPKKLDAWSLGILWLLLLDGLNPMRKQCNDENDHTEVQDLIVACGSDSASFYTQYSEQYADKDEGTGILTLIWELLQPGPEERATVAHVMYKEEMV